MPCSIKHIVRCENFILQNIGEGRAVSAICRYRYAKKVLEITKQLVGVNVFKTNDIVREIKLLSVNYYCFWLKTILWLTQAVSRLFHA